MGCVLLAGISLPPPFVSQGNFLDLVISDYQLKSNLISTYTKEKYYIAKYLHTSYVDLDEITIVEKNLLLKFLKDDIEREAQKVKKYSRPNS